MVHQNESIQKVLYCRTVPHGTVLYCTVSRYETQEWHDPLFNQIIKNGSIKNATSMEGYD
jgi:hypothetical protein